MFLEFCNSGHIGEDQIFKIRTSEGAHTLPLHQVATVLLRLNKRFYDSDNSYIKNLFSIRQDDPIPVYFCRYMILNWLKEYSSLDGPGGHRGYFPKSTVKSALMPFGLNSDVLDREFKVLLEGHCIIAEHLKLDSLEDNDLIKLGPAGFVHLELVANFNYLAAVAEDTFFGDRTQAEVISERIRVPERHLSITTTISNAKELVDYLERQRAYLEPPSGGYLNDDILLRISNIESAKAAISRVVLNRSGDPWFEADKRIPKFSKIAGIIVSVLAKGYIVEFEDSLSGFISIERARGLHPDVGDKVLVEVLWVDCSKQKMGLKLEEILREEAGDEIPT
jgi:hypothetical protein